MIGVQRLHDRFAARLAAAGAAGHLRQQLEGSLRGAEIGEAEADVGGHHADQRHPREVVPLGDHLGADQDVDRALAEAREQRRERPLLADRVAIQPRDARAGACLLHLRLDPLGAEAGLLEIRTGAQRARRRHARGVVAVVAARAPGVALAVHDQRDAAVRAVDRAGALAAEHRGRETAAVEQDQRLFLPIEPRLNPLAQRAAEDDVRPLGRVRLAHVDDRHRRERPVEHPALEDNALVLAGHRVVIALHRRRRRSEDDQRAGALRPDDRDVAPVVARALLLLVRAVMLLVDDDQADLLERREHRRAGADDDVDVAAADALPLVVALAVGKTAVLDGDALAERLAEERGGGRGQGDFGDQHQDAPTGVAHLGRQADVDLRLAAAGDAVQQGDMKRARVGQPAQPREGVHLLAGQLTLRQIRVRPGSDPGLTLIERIAVDAVLAEAEIATLAEAGDGIGCDPARGEGRGANSCRCAGQKCQRLALLRRHLVVVGQRFEPGGGDRRHPRGFVRVGAAAARHRRQQRRDRVADAGGVVLRRPARQGDHLRGDEGGRVQDLAERLEVRRSLVLRSWSLVRPDVHLDDDAGDDAGAERDDDARADARHRGARGHGVGQQIETGNRNRDMDERLRR